MAIKGILFDKDGTIVDYWRTWLPINREVALFAAAGDRALADELLRLGGQDPATGRVAAGSPLAVGSVADIADTFAAHPGVKAPSNFLAEIDRIFSAGGARHSELVDGARETIAELKRRGLRLGIATNDSIGGLEASLGRHDILGLFDFTAGCDSGFGAKPDPRMVLAFCAAVDLAPREVAMVGDAVSDLAMGRAAGVGLAIGVLGGTSERDDLDGYADLILDSINELLSRAELCPSLG